MYSFMLSPKRVETNLYGLFFSVYIAARYPDVKRGRFPLIGYLPIPKPGSVFPKSYVVVLFIQ